MEEILDRNSNSEGGWYLGWIESLMSLVCIYQIITDTLGSVIVAESDLEIDIFDIEDARLLCIQVAYLKWK